MLEKLTMIIPRHWRREVSAPLRSSSLDISLDAAGLVALADLKTIPQRTALTGTSALLDSFVLCPGMHRQQSAPELNGGEYPACGALTSGYVFRVENPATVLYLQKVGFTGQLTTLSVKRAYNDGSRLTNALSLLFTFQNASRTSSVAYLTAVALTLSALILLGLSQKWWGLTVLLFLCISRLCNVVVVRRRTDVNWQGAPEPGVHGDLLILLSQDRWIRMRGLVDDLKAVTSGEWLRQKSFVESSITAFATVFVYINAALASNIDQVGKIILLALLIANAAILAIANETTQILQMHGRVIQVEGPRRQYKRRLDMVEQLVRESGRDDWALRMGMTVQKTTSQQGVTM